MKMISIFGDSICTFEGYNVQGYLIYYNKAVQEINGISSVADMWWHKVITCLNGQLCSNNSCAGSMVTGNDPVSATDDARIDNLSAGSADPDVILVAMGFNDYGFGADIVSFEKAYGLMLDKLSARYPNARIICGTIAASYISERSTSLFPLTPGKYTINDFNEIIRMICRNKSILLADIAAENVCYESLDGVHPTAAGHDTLARLWTEHIQKDLVLT